MTTDEFRCKYKIRILILTSTFLLLSLLCVVIVLNPVYAIHGSIHIDDSQYQNYLVSKFRQFEVKKATRISEMLPCVDKAKVNKSPEVLIARMTLDDMIMKQHKHWSFVQNRIQATYDEMVTATWRVVGQDGGVEQPVLQVLLVPGIMLATEMAQQGRVKRGSPTGDLVQWADLASSLWAMGHNVTVKKDMYAVLRGLKYMHYQWKKHEHCGYIDFDLIYMDIISYKAIKKYLPIEYTCKLRILDAYGTHAAFNNREYVETHTPDYNSIYGSLSLNLGQFNTFYPHTVDNSFLGFAVQKQLEENFGEKENIALLYGKNVDYFKDNIDYINELKLGFQVHTTIENASMLPDWIVNHGVLSQNNYQDLLRKSKLLVGFGLPLESSGVIEATSFGVVFINPSFNVSSQNILRNMGKPTARKITSQVTYLENKNNSYTLDITNMEEIRKMIHHVKEIKKFTEYVPDEFTYLGFTKRLYRNIKYQNFCENSVKINNVTDLDMIIGDNGVSCENTCREKDMICDRSSFAYFSSNSFLFKSIGPKHLHGISCVRVDRVAEPIVPAFNDRGLCVLQLNFGLNSCAGEIDHWRRLCPCRQ